MKYDKVNPLCERCEKDNKPLLAFKGKWICGLCYLEIQRKLQDNFWEKVDGND